MQQIVVNVSTFFLKAARIVSSMATPVVTHRQQFFKHILNGVAVVSERTSCPAGCPDDGAHPQVESWPGEDLWGYITGITIPRKIKHVLH